MKYQMQKIAWKMHPTIQQNKLKDGVCVSTDARAIVHLHFVYGVIYLSITYNCSTVGHRCVEPKLISYIRCRTSWCGTPYDKDMQIMKHEK